jgi:hypothetical protein
LIGKLILQCRLDCHFFATPSNIRGSWFFSYWFQNKLGSTFLDAFHKLYSETYLQWNLPILATPNLQKFILGTMCLESKRFENVCLKHITNQCFSTFFFWFLTHWFKKSLGLKLFHGTLKSIFNAIFQYFIRTLKTFLGYRGTNVEKYCYAQ